MFQAAKRNGKHPIFDAINEHSMRTLTVGQQKPTSASGWAVRVCLREATIWEVISEQEATVITLRQRQDLVVEAVEQRVDRKARSKSWKIAVQQMLLVDR